jgi:hypothetical protein
MIKGLALGMFVKALSKYRLKLWAYIPLTIIIESRHKEYSLVMDGWLQSLLEKGLWDGWQKLG